VRGLLRHYLLYSNIFLAALLFFIQGCARPVLQTYPASELEVGLVTEAFTRYQEINENSCFCCLDAEADAALSVSGWFTDHSGKVSGYLQAMQPGYIKFVAINPLGQPLFILVTNGTVFKSLNVFEEKAYLGSVHSEAYKKFAPPGFEPDFSYYWLVGRLQPGDNEIHAVMHDRELEQFWLQISHANSSIESLILFDPMELVILRHVMMDEHGKHLLDMSYADHQALFGKTDKYSGGESAAIPKSIEQEDLCKVPARITLSSRENASKIELKLSSFLEDAHFSADDFLLDIPDNFEQILVK
jgi:hypothetical protein